jgi:hypothetical protein
MKRIYIIEFLKREQKFLLAGMRMQKDEGGGRILLGDNTGVGAVMLRPIRFRCVGVWFSVALLCSYIGTLYRWPHAYSNTTCAKLNFGAVTTAYVGEGLYYPLSF